MAFYTHATGILVRQFGTGLSHIGIAHHATQFLVVVKRCLGNGQHTLEGWILREVVHQLSNGLIHVWLTCNGDTFSFLTDHLAAIQYQRRVRRIFQTLRVLRNQNAVVKLTAIQLGMRVSADDDVHPRQLCRELHVVLITQMRE